MTLGEKAAEKLLRDYRLYVGYLVNEIESGQFTVHATARQRAEAFVKTMKG